MANSSAPPLPTRSSHADVKPMFSFEESDDKVTFVLVIDGLKVERNLLKGLNKQPKNALLLNQIINEQSINIALELKTDRKIYRFEIKRLPTQINPDRTKLKFEKDTVIIELHKRQKEPWKPFIETDFETIHLVRN